MTEKEYWYWLCNLKGIGIKKIEALLEYFKTPYQIYCGKENDLKQIGKLNEKDVASIIYSRNTDVIKRELEILEKMGIQFITKVDKEYPRRLRNIFDAPIALYVKGRLPKEDYVSIAVIGARNCTNYGKEIAKLFALELSKYNIEIISGLARGIDSCAHIGSLKAEGATFGVLGCGIDLCYPAENIDLYMQIQQTGGIISEYGLGVRPIAGNFPMRNRIISGLSDGILVIEAKEKSGSLITVDMGLEQGKNIYAIPGKVTDGLSEGCNNLIKMGAKLVTNPTEIIDDFLLISKKLQDDSKKNNLLLETEEKIVYASLSLEPKHIEEIILETKLSRNLIIDILLTLELKNYVKEIMKNYYVQILSEIK